MWTGFIYLAQDRVHWHAVVNALVKLLYACESWGIAWLDELLLAYQKGICPVLYCTGVVPDWDIYNVVINQIITGQSTQKSVCMLQKLYLKECVILFVPKRFICTCTRVVGRTCCFCSDLVVWLPGCWREPCSMWREDCISNLSTRLFLESESKAPNLIYLEITGKARAG